MKITITQEDGTTVEIIQQSEFWWVNGVQGSVGEALVYITRAMESVTPGTDDPNPVS